MRVDETVESGGAMEALGARIAQASVPGMLIHLTGDLGAGKTTFARGFLRALGHSGPVKSPTFTVVEPYEVRGQTIYHCDLYRLADPQELEFLGFRDLLGPGVRCLVEWPERGGSGLPDPDLLVSIHYSQPGRRVSLVAMSAAGERALAQENSDKRL